MDRLTIQHRSWNMSRIRCADTAPEIEVRAILHRLGFRFRKSSSRNLPGRPDVVLPKYKTVVLVHGCFWHRHRGCKFAYTPKSRQEFWSNKFSLNQKRDMVVARQLRHLGWRIVVVWECEIQSGTDARRKVLHRLQNIRAREGQIGRRTSAYPE